MKLLVGIPTHKRPELLRECLASIAAQEGDLPAIEVFIADNDASSRQGLAVAREMTSTFRFPLSGAVVEEPGISAVRNAILNEGRRREADFIAMIDDDETASPVWLNNLFAMQRETGVDVVGGPVHFEFSETPPPSVLASKTFRTPTRPGGRTHALWGSGNFLVATNALERSGWPIFDDQFGLTGGEDKEWFTRIEKLGLAFAWAPDALTTEKVHADRANERWILKRAYRCGNCDVRVAVGNWPSRELPRTLWKVALTIGSAPILAPLLLSPRRRLWLLRAWWTAAGSISAIFGHRFLEYAGRHSSGKSRSQREPAKL